MPTYNFSAIPAELRELKQWILWKYEDKGGSKATKVPYSSAGYLASVTDPSSWCDFNTAFNIYNLGGHDGLGFVFTENDPYAFIDLDHTTDKADYERQLRVSREFNSYSEVSPSGQGLHIIIKGSIPQGRKRSSIEIYSNGRYATMTGSVYENKPIENRHELLNMLFQQMGGPAVTNSTVNEPQVEADAEIIEIARTARNGDKFSELYAGSWQSYYSTQSEADFALVDIIAFYTQNRNQIERIFKLSALGRRDKANRKDYLEYMISKSFDRMLPKLDMDGWKIAADEYVAEQKQLALPLDKPEDEVVTHNIENDKWFISQLEAGIISVSEEGRVFNHKTEREIGAMGSGGYPKISLTKEKDENGKWIICHMQIHRLVWLKYKGIIPQGMIVNHKDFNRSNPKLDNLELITLAENTRHAVDAGKMDHTLFKAGNTEHEKRESYGNRYGTVEKQIRLLPPPGLVGEIAQFIYQSAPRPIPEVAIAGAMGLMAGICGRAYNVSGTGLNQYILLLARTGSGKEAMAYGIDKIINAVQMSVPVASEFIGPSEIQSGQALIKNLAENSSYVSILGEFGLRLRAMSSERANGAEIALRRMLLDLYNKSGFGQVVRPTIYSDKAKNVAAISSPAFSILGESTPDKFYDVLNEEMIAEGLLPRFMLIEYNGERPALNENAINIQPSIPLVEKIANLMANAKTITANRKVINVEHTPEAEKMLKDFDKLADAKINSTDKEVILQLWNRAHIKALKISALLACGQNIFNPIVQPADVEWALNIVVHDIDALSEKFHKGLVGRNTEESKQVEDFATMVRRFYHDDWDKLKSYCNDERFYHARIVPYHYMSKRLVAMASFRNDRLGATNAIKRTIQTLIDSDFIREVPKKELMDKLGTTQRAFMVTNMKFIGGA